MCAVLGTFDYFSLPCSAQARNRYFLINTLSMMGDARLLSAVAGNLDGHASTTRAACAVRAKFPRTQRFDVRDVSVQQVWSCHYIGTGTV